MTNGKKARVVKDPVERKKEILDGAMHLFVRNGYEQTSMRDIANELQISLGLCYRYYDSKHSLFEAAMQQYVEEICASFLGVLNDNTIELEDKLDLMFSEMAKEDDSMKYHEFFHRPENKEHHKALGVKLCECMLPHLRTALQQHCKQHRIKLRNPEIFLHFITYGQIGLTPDLPDPVIIKTMKEYILTLLKLEIVPDH